MIDSLVRWRTSFRLRRGEQSNACIERTVRVEVIIIGGLTMTDDYHGWGYGPHIGTALDGVVFHSIIYPCRMVGSLTNLGIWVRTTYNFYMWNGMDVLHFGRYGCVDLSSSSSLVVFILTISWVVVGLTANTRYGSMEVQIPVHESVQMYLYGKKYPGPDSALR